MKIKDGVRFQKWTCGLYAAMYSQAQLALYLHTGREMVATITVNVPDAIVPKGCVLVRNTEDGEGMVQALVEQGIVEDTGEKVQSGFIQLHVCKLLVKVPGYGDGGWNPRAFVAGMQAYEGGKVLADNPYNTESQVHFYNSWRAGHSTASAEAEAEARGEA